MYLEKAFSFVLPLTGELEDVQETPPPEPAPGTVAANLITLQGDDRRDGNGSPSLSHESVPQGEAIFKEDSGENTALLETGRSDSQHGGPVS